MTRLAVTPRYPVMAFNCAFARLSRVRARDNALCLEISGFGVANMLKNNQGGYQSTNKCTTQNPCKQVFFRWEA